MDGGRGGDRSTYGGGGGSGRGGLLQVKNKTAATVQITAEQLLREAVDRQADDVQAPKQRIMDDDELQEYRVRKRKEFEDLLRRSRNHMGNWIKYALWEAAQHEFRRARSIFERAFHIDYRNTTLWSKYIEMESTNKFVNSARNLYDRVTQLLPRVDQFWFKYAHMEEVLGNYAGARAIFERWMVWEPDDKAWLMYIKFEERCKELDLARSVFERYISCRPAAESFLRFAKFEERQRSIVRARAAFEKAVEVLPVESLSQEFYIKFAQFELRQREKERANAVFKAALKVLPKDASEELYIAFVSFQKQHVSRTELEETVLSKRRYVYEEQVNLHPDDYDAWFDYLRLEEENVTSPADYSKVREVYERAVANLPPVDEIKYWKRYSYFWMNYALFEEIVTDDIDRCRAVYSKAIEVIPQRRYPLAKLWQLFAEFEVRQLNIDAARKIYGRAIAECGKQSIFTNYANLELRLGNIDRCRKIYAKYIECFPSNPKTWIALVDLEILAEEVERAQAICEIAIETDQIDFPELIWKAYIDIEVSNGENEKARQLYERLLIKAPHFKVYRSYADFEFDEAQSIENARKVLQRGIEMCIDGELDEERKSLLEHRLHLEKENGDEAMIQKVWQMQPRKVIKKRNVVGTDGVGQGWEEYSAYIFPGDHHETQNFKILAAAKKWKAAQKKL